MRFVLFYLLMACGDKDNRDALYCTEIGCSDSITISIESAGDSFVEGEYSIQISGDGAMLHDCQIRMSNDTDECAGEQPCAAETDCDAIYSSSRWTFNIGGSPDKMTVDVYLDASSVLNAEIEPEYALFQPNGPDCEPTCRVAENESFTLSN